MDKYTTLKTISPKVKTLMLDFKAELRANERLKWLVLIIGCLLYIGPVIYLENLSSKTKAETQSSQAKLAQLKAQVSETRWPERAAEAEQFVSQLEQRYWPGDTPGLAEAGFERWIRTNLERHGMEVRQVQLSRGPVANINTNSETLSSLQHIRAKVLAPLEEVGLIRFLNDTATSQPWVIVEKLMIRPGRNARVEMDLMTVFKIRDGAG
ncbi:MAG: hypothetical protein RIF37_13715 [Rhodospirillaceae bacterium]